MSVAGERLAAAPRGGGLARWSIHHPVGVVMIALAVMVLGGFSLGRLGVDLLPHIIYPEVRVRIIDPGVPAKIMEDRITRQLEEQLAITEDAIGVQSRTREGRSAVDLSFEYGKDIDVALRDASTRLDRAKRFLPDTIDPPIIFKRDPSQIPVLELIVSSPLRDPVDLRTWVDFVFAKLFLNLPGVAAAEVGGGMVREVRVLPDQQRLAGLGLTVDDLVEALRRGNQETAGGRLRMPRQEITSRTSGRFTSVEDIAELPIEVARAASAPLTVRLREVAQVIDDHEDERLRIRLNGLPGIKVSVQKQPQANTVAVVDAVHEHLALLKDQGLLPGDISVHAVSDQAVYVRNAINNASLAALSGALLAMAVVFLFLGDLRRTLIIGSAIPIAILVTLMLMDAAGLTLNIMTLGGLALGIGMLVDNTIVMLENIYRHQRAGEAPEVAATTAAAEVNGAIVASTSTNLAAVLPFLFIGGLTGLLFRELIATISAAIVASLLVALTLVPALGARVAVGGPGLLRRGVDAAMAGLQGGYARVVATSLRVPWLAPLVFVAGLAWAAPGFMTGKQIFLPDLDEGRVTLRLVADSGISLDEMDETVRTVEALLARQPEVASVYSQVGGYVFGRSAYEATNRSSLLVQLVPVDQRTESSRAWIARMQKAIADLGLAGVKVRMTSEGVRGIRISRADDDISVRIQGADVDTLARLGESVVARLDGIAGLRDVRHSSEDLRQELSVVVDRDRAAALGLDIETVGRALNVALQGVVATDFIDGDRSFDVRVQLPQREMTSVRDLDTVLLFPEDGARRAVYLGDVARVEVVTTPSDILRDRQQRIVEVNASLTGERTLGEVLADIDARLADLALPAGYTRYDGGALDALNEGQRLGHVLLGLALFLVLVVMAVQYESLRNPLVILLSVPFAAIGVAAGIAVLDMPLSMPVWLGMIMLAGIVVNNAIVLVEYIELERGAGLAPSAAIVQAARLRLRPILMTSLTTVVGMAPLAAGLGEGAEMLQPLAVTIVWGLSFSTLVSLLLVPSVYRLLCARGAAAHPVPAGGVTSKA